MIKGLRANYVVPREYPRELLPDEPVRPLASRQHLCRCWPSRYRPLRAMKLAGGLKHKYALNVQIFDTPWFRSEPGKNRAMTSERAVNSSPFRSPQHQTLLVSAPSLDTSPE